MRAAPEAVIAELMGRRSVVTTRRYNHQTAEERQKAIRVLAGGEKW